jgi:hypothetical protein
VVQFKKLDDFVAEHREFESVVVLE